MITKQNLKETYHHGDLRHILIQEATKIVSNDGDQHLSLRELAKQCAVSQTSVYRHFKNKQHLLTEVAVISFRNLTKLMHRNIKNITDISQRLTILGTTYIAYARAHPHLFRLMFVITNKNEFTELKQAGQENFSILIATVEEGIQKNVFKAEAKSAVLSAWSLVHGLSMLIVDNKIPSTYITISDELIKNVVVTLQTGLLNQIH